MWAAVILAISSNLDDLTIAFSLGIKEGILNPRTMIIIALISGLTMGLGIFLGELFTNILPVRLETYLGTIIFFGFGVWFFIEGFKQDKGLELRSVKKFKAKREQRSLLTAIGLGLLLGIGSLVLGFSGGLSGFPILFTAVMTSGSSLLFLWSGSHLGEKLAGLIGRIGHFLAGALLFLLAIAEFMGLL